MRKIRIVHVGCGAISDAWLRPLKSRNDVEIVGMVDLKRESAVQRAGKYGLTGAAIDTDLSKVLAKTQPDAVCDCTVPEAHMKVTILALKRGCHVFGEKPLADTMANARKMVSATRRAGKIYAVMQNRRYMANIQALQRFLAGGNIGNVTTIHCDFFIGAHFGGFRDKMKHVLLLDMAIHTFDQARFISGADPRRAVAHEWNPRGSWYAHGASAVALFEMTKGVVFCYRGSWCSEGMNTPWESAWRIIGEKGSVLWDGADGFKAEVVSGGDGFKRDTRPLDVPYDRNALPLAGHAGCIDEFIRSVRTGGTPQTVCTDNIKSLSMVHAAIESSAKGKAVDCRWK